MRKMKKETKEVWYDDEADILNVEINDKEYWKSIELPNGVVIDISKDGSMTSIEILNASKLFFGVLIFGILWAVGVYLLYNRQPLGGFSLLFLAGVLYIFRKEIFGDK